MDVQPARHRAVGRTSGSHVVRRRYLLLAIVALVTVLSVEVAQPVAASSPSPGSTPSSSPSPRPKPVDAAQKIIAAATRHLGAPYRPGTQGPRTFDCSGLVFRVFKDTGELAKIGGSRKTARGYMDLFQRRGQASRTHGRPGDLVIYNHGEHIGIYIGHGKVISAIYDGVSKTRLRHLSIPFTEFLHTHLDGAAPAAHHNKSSSVVKATRAMPLRAAPHRVATRLERIDRGTHLKITGRRHDGQGRVWLKVQLPNQDLGWVRKSLTHHI